MNEGFYWATIEGRTTLCQVKDGYLLSFGSQEQHLDTEWVKKNVVFGDKVEKPRENGFYWFTWNGAKSICELKDGAIYIIDGRPQLLSSPWAKEIVWGNRIEE